MAEPVMIATWPFGRIAAEAGLKKLNADASALDSALVGAQAVEDDPSVTSVGYAGIANSIGTVSLDACVMDGETLACGAVGGLENVRHAAAVAKRVMEKTPHILLVGEGAKWFALQQGFPLQTLLTPESVAKWAANKPKEPWDDHDTVTVLARDKKGHLGGVCTTSGLSYKTPGRVGDSPLIGSGLYVDDQAGAAGATGVGEEIIRVGGSFLVVELMRQGKSPQEACEMAIRRVIDHAIRRGKHPASVSFLALSPEGEIGAACTEDANFTFAVGQKQAVEMRRAKQLGPSMK